MAMPGLVPGIRFLQSTKTSRRTAPGTARLCSPTWQEINSCQRLVLLIHSSQIVLTKQQSKKFAPQFPADSICIAALSTRSG